MILAEINVENIVVPEHIQDAAVGSLGNISINTANVPFGADAWILCEFALPHIDPLWKRQLFLTLAVCSFHSVGDAKAREEDHVIRPGSLFVIDPMTKHWLFPDDYYRQGAAYSFIGLQWEVPRRSAKQHARRIVQQLGGVWRDNDDRRYQSWRPQ